MTQTNVQQATDHKHVGGSGGGEGQNSAECACGIVFGGFDTHAEVMAELDEHIARGNDPAERVEPKRDPWAVFAAKLTSDAVSVGDTLRAIAADLAALSGSGLPVPSYFKLNVEINGQPGGAFDDVEKARCVDAMGQILLGRDGELAAMSTGGHHYRVRGERGPVEVNLYNSVTPAWVELQTRDAELTALRAQLATAEADAKRLRERLAEHQQPRCVASMHIPDEGASCAVCGAADMTAADAQPIVEAGPTCKAERAVGQVCGAPIRPAFNNDRAWVHTSGIRDHTAVGPTS